MVWGLLLLCNFFLFKHSIWRSDKMRESERESLGWSWSQELGTQAAFPTRVAGTQIFFPSPAASMGHISRNLELGVGGAREPGHPSMVCIPFLFWVGAVLMELYHFVLYHTRLAGSWSDRIPYSMLVLISAGYIYCCCSTNALFFLFIVTSTLNAFSLLRLYVGFFYMLTLGD